MRSARFERATFGSGGVIPKTDGRYPPLFFNNLADLPSAPVRPRPPVSGSDFGTAAGCKACCHEPLHVTPGHTSALGLGRCFRRRWAPLFTAACAGLDRGFRRALGA